MPMPLENGHDGKENQYPEQLSQEIEEEKVAASDPEAGGHPVTSQETATAIKEEITPAPRSPEEQEELNKSYYAEASLAKKIIVFALATLFTLITIGLIYAYWPIGTPR
jgi:hypothetical protein